MAVDAGLTLNSQWAKQRKNEAKRNMSTRINSILQDKQIKCWIDGKQCMKIRSPTIKWRWYFPSRQGKWYIFKTKLKWTTWSLLFFCVEQTDTKLMTFDSPESLLSSFLMRASGFCLHSLTFMAFVLRLNAWIPQTFKIK